MGLSPTDIRALREYAKNDYSVRYAASILALCDEWEAQRAEIARLREYAKEVETERLTMARLAADTPQFDNPLIIYAARERRDEILAGVHLRTAASLLPTSEDRSNG